MFYLRIAIKVFKKGAPFVVTIFKRPSLVINEDFVSNTLIDYSKISQQRYMIEIFRFRSANNVSFLFVQVGEEGQLT